MNFKISLMLALVFVSALPLSAGDRKKGQLERGMLEKMEAVPCGSKQRGLAGLGALWGSAGIVHVNSTEKLCPQYLLRSDQMDYEIRPMNLKHARILPVGTEGEFKMKKNEMELTAPEDGDRKTRTYEVVSMTPNNDINISKNDDDQKQSSNLAQDKRSESQ